MCRVISIANAKGGVCKTTITKALSLGLKNKGYRVLAIDLDEQGSLSMGMGINRPADFQGLSTLLMAKQNEEEADPCSVICEALSGVHLMIGNKRLRSFDVSLFTFPGGLFYLESIIKELREYYDFILIDCKPNISALTQSALIASDEVIIPTYAEYYSFEGLEDFLHEISLIQKKYNPSLYIAGVVPSNIDKRKNEHIDFLTRIYEDLGESLNIFEYIPTSTVVSSSSCGIDMYIGNTKDQGVNALRKLTNRILQITGEENSNGTK